MPNAIYLPLREWIKMLNFKLWINLLIKDINDKKTMEKSKPMIGVFFCVKEAVCFSINIYHKHLLYITNLSKMSFVRYGCLKDVFCTLWTSQRRLLYVMYVSKTSFVHYGYVKDVFCTLRICQRRLLYITNVSKTS